MKRTLLSSLFLGPALLFAALVLPGAVAAAGPIVSTACSAPGGAVTCNLFAETGTLALPGTTVPVWGYATTSGGSPTVPGPVLVVNEGDTVTVNLTNHLAPANAVPQVPTSIVFGGQAMVPDQTGVAGGGTKTYTFTASAPGTYLYEAGLIPGSEYQVAMGMYGVLVVRSATPGQAYDDPGSAYNEEALVVLGEVDPSLNTNSAPWTVDLRYFAPKYSLINGAAYPGTTSIAVTSGNKLLLRYANAGIQHHSIGVLGLRQSVLAADGSPIAYPRNMVAETIAPGQTADVLVTLPPTTAASTKYALYDAALGLNNNGGSAFGGMLAFIDAAPSGVSTGDTVGPITSSVALNTSTGVLTASISDVTTGNANVNAAEYFIDTAGPAGTGTAMDPIGAFGSPTVSVTKTISVPGGTHTVYVRGHDVSGNWGTVSSVTFSLDTAGPTTSALVLNPNPNNGTGSVVLTATASDVASGNSNVVAAEYFLGATGAPGSGLPMTLNTTATIVSLTWTIPAGPGGVVSVRARDAAGNWGPFATITRVLDTTGPTTSSVVASPNPNNGTLGVSSSNPSVRVTASFSDALSSIATGEGFIGALGANGAGFPFFATDGAFNTPLESGYADIPLTTINALSSGNNTISVHGKDAAGNWGAAATVTLVIDRTSPSASSIVRVGASPTGAASVQFLVTFSESVTGVTSSNFTLVSTGLTGTRAITSVTGAGAAWTVTATTGTGTGTLGLNLTTATNIKDLAGNAMTAAGLPLVGQTYSIVPVIPDAIFSDGFEAPTTLPGNWTSRSTTTATRLNNTTTSALIGLRGLQAQGNNTNYVQYNFGTAANPASATFDARFYFNPNGNTGTNQDILVARTTGGTSVFRTRYRMNAGQSQVQIQIGTGTANTLWTNLTNSASNRIEVVWQSGTSLQLYVNGTLSQTLVAGANSVGQVRMGSVTSGGNATLEFFDAFAAKRSVSPLVGP